MSAPRPRVAILLAWTQDPSQWTAKHARDEARDTSPYGYARADSDFDIEWCRSKQDKGVHGWLRRRVARHAGFDLVHAWQNRKTLFRADVVWTHTEREHLAVALLQRLSLRPNRIQVVAQSVWLWDDWPRWGTVRKCFIAWLLRTHTIELVHSSVNLQDSRKAVPGRRVEQVPFGTTVPEIEADRRSKSKGAVLAVGNDADRDWHLLSEVAGLLAEVQFRIATRSRAARSIGWPANVLVAPAPTIENLDELYANASAIVVPTRPNRHASGATSLIEALAVGCPTIATSSGGLEEYAGPDAQLVPPGDRDALAKAITDALGGLVAEPQRDGYIRRGLTQADYVQRYVLVTKWMLRLIPYPEVAFRFTSVQPTPNVFPDSSG